MRIILIPQGRDRNKIWYEIEHQKITATINGVSDTFDFTDMPDGELQLYDDEGNELIETKLEEVPILGAEKTDGVLTVEILFSTDTNEKDERLLFPKPMTLAEFNKLMGELNERKEEVVNEEYEVIDIEEVVNEEYEVIDIEEVDF